MEEKKGNLKRMNGIYKSREVDKEEQNWKRWSMQFECEVESGERKLLTFKAFTPWTKKDGDAKKGIDIDSLEVDKEYNISYSEFQNEQMDYPSKTAVVFFDSKSKGTQPEQEKPYIVGFDKVVGDSISITPELTTIPNTIIGVGHFQSFGEAYKKKFSVDMRDYAHFMKTFIDSCHSNGIAVISDWVLTLSCGQPSVVHLYWDRNAGSYGQPTAENPWYNEQSPNPLYSWGYDFDHESQATKDFVDRVNEYWLTEYHFDGFRFDFTKGFTNTPGDGGAYDASRISILKRMADQIWNVNPNAYVILEHFATNTEEKELAKV